MCSDFTSSSLLHEYLHGKSIFEKVGGESVPERVFPIKRFPTGLPKRENVLEPMSALTSERGLVASGSIFFFLHIIYESG